MRQPGQIALLRFPQTDLSAGKPRPVALLGRVPGPYDDWLVCMVSSQLRQEVRGFDEVVHDSDADFARSGLKVTSVLRISRVAVVEGNALLGAVGEISPERLRHIRERLARWIGGDADEVAGDRRG